MREIQAIEVKYYAFYGDRRCEVTGFITEELAEKWRSDGWRIVTEATNREVPIYGELVEVVAF